MDSRATEIKHSTHNATFFKVPRLQDMVVEKLLKDKDSVMQLSDYLDTLSSREKAATKSSFRCQRLVQELSQAVIDDESEKVAMILDFNPELLLIEPKEEGVTEIESKLTWQQFVIEKPFIGISRDTCYYPP